MSATFSWEGRHEAFIKKSKCNSNSSACILCVCVVYTGQRDSGQRDSAISERPLNAKVWAIMV